MNKAKVAAHRKYQWFIQIDINDNLTHRSKVWGITKIANNRLFNKPMWKKLNGIDTHALPTYLPTYLPTTWTYMMGTGKRSLSSIKASSRYCCWVDDDLQRGDLWPIKRQSLAHEWQSRGRVGGIHEAAAAEEEDESSKHDNFQLW